MFEETYLVYAIARVEAGFSVDVTTTREEAVMDYPVDFVRDLGTPPAATPAPAPSREDGPGTSPIHGREYVTSIEIDAIAFPTADEALQHTNAIGLGSAISLGGETLVVSEVEAKRLEAAGIQFAYLCERQGRIVTIPTNGPFCVWLVDLVEDSS